VFPDPFLKVFPTAEPVPILTEWGTSLISGVVASSALVLGAFIGARFELPKRVLAIMLSFAAGALITALTFELFEDATSAAASSAPPSA
jgi:zinc transporter ZupT